MTSFSCAGNSGCQTFLTYASLKSPPSLPRSLPHRVNCGHPRDYAALYPHGLSLGLSHLVHLPEPLHLGGVGKRQRQRLEEGGYVRVDVVIIVTRAGLECGMKARGPGGVWWCFGRLFVASVDGAVHERPGTPTGCPIWPSDLVQGALTLIPSADTIAIRLTFSRSTSTPPEASLNESNSLSNSSSPPPAVHLATRTSASFSPPPSPPSLGAFMPMLFFMSLLHPRPMHSPFESGSLGLARAQAIRRWAKEARLDGVISA